MHLIKTYKLWYTTHDNNLANVKIVHLKKIVSICWISQNSYVIASIDLSSMLAKRICWSLFFTFPWPPTYAILRSHNQTFGHWQIACFRLLHGSRVSNIKNCKFPGFASHVTEVWKIKKRKTQNILNALLVNNFED